MTTTDIADLTERLWEAVAEARDGGERTAHDVDSYDVVAAILPMIAAEVQAAKAEALREAAHYFASGLHCADMRSTPEETVRELNRRATEYETGDRE